ncbi:MAG: hypothetical protein WCO52_03780 [bacterium]
MSKELQMRVGHGAQPEVGPAWAPVWVAENVAMLPFQYAAQAGHVHWIFDLDRVLLPAPQLVGLRWRVCQDFCQAIHDAQVAGYIQNAAIVTNVAFPLPQLVLRTKSVGRQLGIENIVRLYLYKGNMKPHPWGGMRAMEMMGSTPDTTIFCGDMISKDGLCAKSCGIPFVHVQPYGPNPLWKQAIEQLPRLLPARRRSA